MMQMARYIFLLLLSSFLLSSCALFQERTYTWDWRRDHPAYHQKAKEYLTQEASALLTLIPRDIQNYCPDYAERNAEERLEFWGLLLSAISWMESSHRTEHQYEEVGIIDSTGENVMSRGLLQFSYESATGYLNTLKEPEELHDPDTSLRIGAIALNRFLTQDGVISQGEKGAWKGAARYWSVLRRNHKHPIIKKWLREADYENPRQNLIPPPPHISPDETKPWFQRTFGGSAIKETTPTATE